MLLRYAVDYTNAAKSLQVVVLMTGIVIGKGVALWVRWGDLRFRHLTPALSPVEAERESHACGFARSVKVLSCLVFLLAASALWQPEMGMEFHYRGIRRWEGVWDNPNTYGLLMGIGVTLAIGLMPSSSRFQSAHCAACRFLSPVTRHLTLALLFVAASLCGFGLLKSYSRGAWRATTVGIGFLFWKWINREPREIREKEISTAAANLERRPWLSRGWCISRLIAQVRLNRVLLLTILVSSFMLCFWQFRDTESPLLRRVFSVGNVNDFSWRNRVTAWQGAGRMILDRPLVGFGWGKAEEVYRREYRAERLEETAAIQLNDYLMLGISAGLPALLCLVIYFALVMSAVTEAERRRNRSTRNIQLSTPATAGAAVLLIGFWFDGGLFKLQTGVAFWMLLELARGSSRGNDAQSQREKTEETDLDTPEGFTANYTKHAKMKTALRWLAGMVAVLASGQTVLHLGRAATRRKSEDTVHSAALVGAGA